MCRPRPSQRRPLRRCDNGVGSGVALTERPLRSDTCMTGEITLRGRVLPVGGIKEKILGAVARGLKRAIIPRQNKKDLEDIPAELRKKIEILTVDQY